MAGSVSVPNTFSTQSGNVPASQLDANWTSLINYINSREIGFGLLSARPVAGTHGNWWFATDTLQLFSDNGSAWVLTGSGVAPGGATTGVFTSAVFF